MEILIVGSNSQLKEARQKFGEAHRYKSFADHRQAETSLNDSEVVFDFIIEETPSSVSIYRNHPSLVVFLNTSLITLSQLKVVDFKNIFIGFCGMSTFLNRELLELSLASEDHKSALKDICEKLNTQFSVVADRVGLVTPRVICMIINEAYYTLEEGTASREDIDKAMKLGTNYPYGPFEWCERIGREEVRRLLEAVYRDTSDERYKACEELTKSEIK